MDFGKTGRNGGGVGAVAEAVGEIDFAEVFGTVAGEPVTGSTEEIVAGFGVVDHETLGANFLRKIGFSNKVCRLIASHVNAKRYLTYKFPEYYEQLSEASKRTLDFQGGKMTPGEAKDFQEDKYFERYIQLRKWDEMAKSEIPVDENMDEIRQLIYTHLEHNLKSSSL